MDGVVRCHDYALPILLRKLQLRLQPRQLSFPHSHRLLGRHAALRMFQGGCERFVASGVGHRPGEHAAQRPGSPSSLRWVCISGACPEQSTASHREARASSSSPPPLDAEALPAGGHAALLGRQLSAPHLAATISTDFTRVAGRQATAPSCSAPRPHSQRRGILEASKPAGVETPT